MINSSYSKACTEVVEILKYLDKEELSRIPKERIDEFEKNKDTSYEFKIDPNMPLEEQHISTEANAIMVILFRDYFATETQKEKLKKILDQNEKKYQASLREKYNPDNIFNSNNNNTDSKNESNIKANNQENNEDNNENSINEKKSNENLPIEVKENGFFKKLIDFLKGIFKFGK